MQRFNLEPGFILHRRPYQETSLLLEVFTREQGRFSAIAKGAKRAKSKARGLLQPFVPLFISCAGRGELLAVKEFEARGSMHFLQGRALISGFYMNELMIRLVHRFDPHQELFDKYSETLCALEHCRPENQGLLDHNRTEQNHVVQNHTDQNHADQKILRLFEKFILKAIGYDLLLNKEAETGDYVIPDAWYSFDPLRGPVLIQEKPRSVLYHQPSKSSKSKLLIVKGKSLLALQSQAFEDSDSAILLDVKRLMRAALRHHLGEKPLQSRRLL